MIRVVSARGGGLWEQAADALRASYRAGHEVLLLVPEQYTLQAERDALEALEVKGFFRLQVLSPSRLANYVFDRAGRDERSLIDERGQALTSPARCGNCAGSLPTTPPRAPSPALPASWWKPFQSSRAPG